jgi:sialic acid synthase SpsE
LKTFIIAEMAWSHTGSANRAVELLKSAKEAGADAVSIHITNMETYMTKDYNCVAGQTLSDRDADDNTNVYDYLDEINLSHEEWLEFDKISVELEMKIVAMCNDIESFEFSKQMDIYKYVIAASSFYEYDFIAEIIKYNSDVIIRTGGANLDEITDIVNFIFNTDSKSKINLLAGIQLYPTPIDQLHMKSIASLRDKFEDDKISLGLADHIDGDHPYAKYLPAIALAYGAVSLEKHITTTREEKLEDYEAALSINDFIDFVNYIRIAEQAIGDGNIDYLINPQNEKYRMVLRKRLVAKTEISKGEIITKEMIDFKRNDVGLELEYINNIMGKKAARKILIDEGLAIKDVL